jgi:uncharacterized OsmC-like protein
MKKLTSFNFAKNLNAFNKFSSFNFAAKFKTKAFYQNGEASTDLGENKLTKIEQPMGAILGILGACETKSIMFQAKQAKIPIEKLEIQTNSEYDLANYLDDNKKQKNTYSQPIDMHIIVSSSEKDKAKVEKVVKVGEEKCPVAQTLKNGGIVFNTKITVNNI